MEVDLRKKVLGIHSWLNLFFNILFINTNLDTLILGLCQKAPNIASQLLFCFFKLLKFNKRYLFSALSAFRTTFLLKFKFILKTIFCVFSRIYFQGILFIFLFYFSSSWKADDHGWTRPPSDLNHGCSIQSGRFPEPGMHSAWRWEINI